MTQHGADTQKMRVEAINIWPAPLTFPAEREFQLLLATFNVVTPITVCSVANDPNPDFHRFLSLILDALDSLPARPDRAFEAFWIAVDVEMVRLKKASISNQSRFKLFLDHLQGIGAPQSVWEAVFQFLEHAPLQACEYAAKRVFDALEQPNEHSESYIKRIKVAVGTDFATDFAGKYLPRMLGQPPQVQSETLRSAGSFIRNVMMGKEMDLNGTRYGSDPMSRLSMIASVVLPNMRNERFHGNVFSSYRSSAVSIKHYAADYFLCILAYYMLLLGIYARWPKAIELSELESVIRKNTATFLTLFKSHIGK